MPPTVALAVRKNSRRLTAASGAASQSGQVSFDGSKLSGIIVSSGKVIGFSGRKAESTGACTPEDLKTYCLSIGLPFPILPRISFAQAGSYSCSSIQYAYHNAGN